MHSSMAHVLCAPSPRKPTKLLQKRKPTFFSLWSPVQSNPPHRHVAPTPPSRRGIPVLARQGGKQVRHWTGEPVHGHKPDFTYLICNPLSGQVSRVPNIRGTTKILRDLGLGLLAQVDRGYGLPDRFAIAMLMADNKMLRFSSETGDWDLATGREPPGPRERPFQRAIATNQEAVAFGGRLWWVDLSCRAVSVDPFSNWPESRFVDLPKGSVLPGPGPGTDGADAWIALRQYRRMGVSDGRLRYAEVSQREPFVLSYFALDEEGAGGDWTLEHRVALSRVWAAHGGHHPWLPLQGDTATPEIAVLDPLNANVIHLIVGDHVVAVDMYAAKVIGSSPLLGHGDNHGFIPCVLGSGQIPSTGKDVSENQSFAHVRVHSNSHWKYEGY
uniref:Uncharacterized protein n=1 Tax=Avena sativa TaxID=4498 RepID=A0ACD5X657_AVESA